MRIECPKCHFSAETDPAKVPPGGRNAKCPRCREVFRVTAPVPVVPPATAPREAACGGVRFGHGRNEILAWAAEGRLAVEAVPDALRIAGALPSPASWRRFLDALALWLGAVFLAVAVIFFFAYNWQALGPFARFGSIELLLVIAVLATGRLGLERTSGKAALLAATLLVGALLALVGQTYQTGADPWELFATWALFVLPWVAISRFAPLWLLLLALANLAIGLYYQVFSGFFGLIFGGETLCWVLAGTNTAALVAWEVAACRAPWLAPRWAPRTVATAALGLMTTVAVWGIVDRASAGVLELGAYAGVLIGVYAAYRHRLRDLYVLALGVLSLVVVVTVFLGHLLLRHNDGPAGFLFIGTVVLALSAAGGWWLRTVGREVEA